MPFHKTVNKWFSRPCQRSNASHHGYRQAPRKNCTAFRPKIERLEDRLLPTLSILGSMVADSSTGVGVGVAVDPNTNMVYMSRVASNTSADVAVVNVSNSSSPSMVTSVSGGFYQVTVNPVTNRFYTTDGYSGDILVYDGSTNALLATVFKGYCHAGLDTDPTTNLIYTESQCGGGNDPVQVLNGANNTLVTGPMGTGGVSSTDVKVNSTTGKVYAAASANGSFWTRVFGPSPNFSFLYDLSSLNIVAVNPVTNRLYFNDSSGNLEVFDGSNDTHLMTVAGVSGEAAVNTILNRIYVMDQTNKVIKTVDGASNTMIGTFSLATNITPENVAVDSSRNLLYVSAIMPDGTTDLYVLQDSAQATHLSVAAPASTVAGTSFSITVSALDASGNIASGYTGTVHFTSSDKKAALPADYTFTAADASVHTFKVALVTAGMQTITATDTVTATITGKSSTIKVGAAAADHLKIKAISSTTAGVPFSITITAQDAFNNTVTNYAGTVHFTSTDSQAVLPAGYTFISSNKGMHSFSGVTLKTAGTQSITATDTATAGVKGSANIAVKPGKASTLSISAPSTVTQGVAFTFILTALDAYGNVATGYTGTVHFSSSDGAASLPANFTFLSADVGVEAFSAIFNTTGTQSLTATDTVTSSITGTDAAIQVNAGAAPLRLSSTTFLEGALSATDLATQIARILHREADAYFRMPFEW